MENERMTREEAEEMWQQGEPVKLRRPIRTATSLLSVRLPKHVLQELTVAGRRQGKGPATLGRELIEQGLAMGEKDLRPVLLRVLARLLEGAPEDRTLWVGATGRESVSITCSMDALHFANLVGPSIERQWKKAYWGRPVSNWSGLATAASIYHAIEGGQRKP